MQIHVLKIHRFGLIALSLYILLTHPCVFSQTHDKSKTQAVQKNESPTEIKIVALGDSLTEGYGIDKDLAYPALIEKRFQKENKNIKVYNAGISGSTSASSVSRLRWFLKNKPTHLFLALGANDGLRGIDPAVTKKNLQDTIKLAKTNNLKVILAGMKMPPNYGVKYTKSFESIFPDLAKEENVTLLPFLLEGVATKRELNQTDGIHPNEKGHAVLAENVYQFLTKYFNTEKKP